MLDEDTTNRILRFLTDYGCLNSFVMGSRRFGYSTADSDLDLAILTTTKEESERLTSKLLHLGATKAQPHWAASYDIHDSTHYILGSVDIIHFSSVTSFQRLENDHRRLALFINNHPEVLNAIRYLKGAGLFKKGEGKYIYQAIWFAELMSQTNSEAGA